MTLSQIYSRLFTGEPVRVACPLATYNTLRTGLIRKYAISANACAQIGDDSLLLQFVQCSYEPSTKIGSFQLKDQTEKKRKPVSYVVL